MKPSGLALWFHFNDSASACAAGDGFIILKLSEASLFYGCIIVNAHLFFSRLICSVQVFMPYYSNFSQIFGRSCCIFESSLFHRKREAEKEACNAAILTLGGGSELWTVPHQDPFHGQRHHCFMMEHGGAVHTILPRAWVEESHHYNKKVRASRFNNSSGARPTDHLAGFTRGDKCGRSPHMPNPFTMRWLGT